MKVAEFVYLNKTCFRGLFRVNQMGGFNVPYGHYDNPSVCDETSYKQISELISDVEFYCLDLKRERKYRQRRFCLYGSTIYSRKKEWFYKLFKGWFFKRKT